MSRRTFVLIVEDDDDLGSVIVESIVSQGYEVRWAPSAHEALSCLREERPSLVLLDWSIPDSDPEDLAAHFHAQGIPVVLASGSEHTAELAQRIGARAVLDKPYDLDELFRVLERFLGPPEAAVHP